jgi:hypothetical protein
MTFSRGCRLALYCQEFFSFTSPGFGLPREVSGAQAQRQKAVRRAIAARTRANAPARVPLDLHMI